MDPRKRILVIRNAMPYDFGGAERFPVHLALEMEKHNYKMMVVSRSAQLLKYTQLHNIKNIRGWWWSQQNWSGIRTLLFPVYLGWQACLIFWYMQLIIRLRPDIVHPQSKDDFIAATIAGKLLNKKVIWTDHADLKYIFANHTFRYKNPVGKLVYLASQWADAITLVSASEKKLIEEAIGHTLPPKYNVIHNGILDATVTAAKRPNEDKVIFCATSRLVMAKGVGELITAFQKVHRKYPQTLLWLVGDGPERQKFAAQAAGDLSIVFMGHTDNPLSYVASCDIFVHPSHHEGFSLSLVEAAMLAKPIIACGVGGNSEIISSGNNGQLVPARDSKALADAMVGLLESPLLQKTYGRAARQTFLDNFEFSRLATKHWIPLYEKL